MTSSKTKRIEKTVDFLAYLSLSPVLFFICAAAYNTIRAGESIDFYFVQLLGIQSGTFGIPFLFATSGVVILFWIRAFVRAGNN